MAAHGNEERPVEVRGLVKRYGDLSAVDRVDLTVESGDVYGFLGPNGAGKTTTLRMLLGLIRRDAGTISLFGRDPAEDPIAALAGVAGFIEEPRLYSYSSNSILGAVLGRHEAERRRRRRHDLLTRSRCGGWPRCRRSRAHARTSSSPSFTPGTGPSRHQPTGPRSGTRSGSRSSTQDRHSSPPGSCSAGAMSRARTSLR